GVLGYLPDPGPQGGKAGRPGWKPSVAVADRRAHRLEPLPTKENRWMRLLDRFRLAPHGIEIHPPAVIGGVAGGPDCFYRLRLFPRDLPSAGEWWAMIFHLLGIPAGPGSEYESSGGQK